MAFKHLCKLVEQYPDIKIKLIVGMTPFDGISLSNHKGFTKIMLEIFPNNFTCGYLHSGPPVHSKLYIWMKDGIPKISFVGSANYTQKAFNELKQKELLTQCDSSIALEYFNQVERDTIYCTHPEVDTSILIMSKNDYLRSKIKTEGIRIGKSNVADYVNQGLDKVEVSLLTRKGEIQKVGGLNWGQRPNRERNQAYIQLAPIVYKGNFFPIKGTHFTVITDDNKTLICTRAQKNEVGTAIETPHNNSLLGEYFRQRLGLANGAFIHTHDLVNYGKTSVTFYKIDDENYYMDFSV
jgi:hypothetical protein